MDEAFTRALADVSKPFAVDSKDDGLSHFQATSRLSDSVASLNDEELLKHLASVLFCRSTANPIDELADSIGELGGGLVSSDLRGITQALPATATSAWGTASVDCDGVSSDTKLTHGNAESAGMPNGIVDRHTHLTTSSVSPASNGTAVVRLSSGSAQSSVSSADTAARHSVPVSTLLPSLSVGTCSCVPVKASTVLSAPADVGGTSLLDSLLAPTMASPVLHVGSLAALPQVLVSTPGSSVLVSAAPGSAGLQQSSVGLPSLQTLPDVHTLMKPSRRYVVDSRPMVTSGLSALPLASIFTPFSTTFCPPPPVPSSSAIKMDHPLAAATVLATVSVAGCSPATVCSSGISAVSSVTPSVSVVQTVLLPSSLSTSSAISCHTSSSGT